MAKPIIVAFTANGVAYTIDGESGLYYPGARLRSVEDLVHISYFFNTGIVITAVGYGNVIYKVDQQFHNGNYAIEEFKYDKRNHLMIRLRSTGIAVPEPFPVTRVVSSIEALRPVAEIRRMQAADMPAPQPEQTKTSSMDYNKLTNVILSKYPDKIRVQGLNKKRTETLNEFMQLFFTKHNVNKNTIYAGSKEVQTEPNKRRSLGDIYMIMTYYYPAATLEEIVKILQKKLPGKIKGFRSSMCSTIKKRTYYYDPARSSEVYNKSEVDEYGYTYDQYMK